MASSYGKKPNAFFSKLKKWAIGLSIVGGTVGAPVYYHHGTKTTETVEVLSKEGTKLFTDKGVIRNESGRFARWLNGKSADDVKLLDGLVKEPGVYEITSYGKFPDNVPLVGGSAPFWTRNVLSVKKVDKNLTETFKISVAGFEVEITAPEGVKDKIKVGKITPPKLINPTAAPDSAQ